MLEHVHAIFFVSVLYIQHAHLTYHIKCASMVSQILEFLSYLPSCNQNSLLDLFLSYYISYSLPLKELVDLINNYILLNIKSTKTL